MLPWVIGGGALALALVGATGFGLWAFTRGGLSERGSEGVLTFEELSKEHVDIGEKVDYGQHPPVGGEHYPFWQNCGVYDEPITVEAAVHSLEHGAVWITHDPDLDPADIERLAAHHSPGSYVIVSPMEDLPSPVVASAWEAQLMLDDASDTRIGSFLRQYEQSPNAPEPGAPCSGAYDGTQAEFDEHGFDMEAME